MGSYVLALISATIAIEELVVGDEALSWEKGTVWHLCFHSLFSYCFPRLVFLDQPKREVNSWVGNALTVLARIGVWACQLVGSMLTTAPQRYMKREELSCNSQ